MSLVSCEAPPHDPEPINWGYKKVSGLQLQKCFSGTGFLEYQLLEVKWFNELKWLQDGCCCIAACLAAAPCSPVPPVLPVAGAMLPARRQLWTHYDGWARQCLGHLGLAYLFSSRFLKLLAIHFGGPKSAAYLLFPRKSYALTVKIKRFRCFCLASGTQPAICLQCIFALRHWTDRCLILRVGKCYFLGNTYILATWWMCTRLWEEDGAR